MSGREPRFEIVENPDEPQPWWARYRAANGKIRWTTETYHRERAAIASIAALPGIRSVTEHSTFGLEANSWAPDSPPIEIRRVTE